MPAATPSCRWDAAPGAVPGGRNGHGGGADVVNFHYSGGGGTGWKSGGGTGPRPRIAAAAITGRAARAPTTVATSAVPAASAAVVVARLSATASGGGGGYSGGGGGTQNGPGGGGGGSFNAGTHQLNLAGIQTGPGYVSLLAMPDLAAVRLQNSHLATRSPLPLAAELEAAGDTAQRGPASGEFRGYF